MRILLTNDDSIRSPLLGFIIEKLETLGELVMVFPKHEQSWRGKSITRFDHVHLEDSEVCGRPCFLIDGTPADCANIGIYHLCSSMPDLVVSGINAGLNTGVAFCLSSGTIGAALEANIAGLPGLAISQHFDMETFNQYVAGETLPEPTIAHLRGQTRRLLDVVFSALLSDPKLLSDPITWNVNFPFKPDQDPEVRVCPMGRTVYGNLFSRRSNVFEHNLMDVSHDDRSECDWQALLDGHITVTPLDIRGFGQLDQPDLQKLAHVLLKNTESI